MKTVDSQGLVNGARKVLGAEAGEELWLYVGQEGQQLDLEPELDESWVRQVLLGQSCWVWFAEDLLKLGFQLREVLQRMKNEEALICWSCNVCSENTSLWKQCCEAISHRGAVGQYSLLWRAPWSASSDVESALEPASRRRLLSWSGCYEQRSARHEPRLPPRRSADGTERKIIGTEVRKTFDIQFFFICQEFKWRIQNIRVSIIKGK